MNVGLVGNRRYRQIEKILTSMAAEAPKVGARLFLEPELAALVPGQAASTLKGAAIDVLLSLGGDGTLLRGARLACERGIPVLGVNLGHVGFLAAGDQNTATELLRRVVRGEYTIESRLALTAHIGDARQISAASSSASWTRRLFHSRASSGSTKTVCPVALAPWTTPGTARRSAARTGITKRSLRSVT